MEALLSWLKLSRDLAWPLVIVSGLMLWGPVEFKSGLGLQPFIETYRDWIGVVFLFFLVLGLQSIGSFIYEIAMDRIREKRKKGKADQEELIAMEEAQRQAREAEEIAENNIKSLTGGEKAILRYFLVNDTRSQDLDMQNGDVAKLTSIGFVFPVLRISYGGRKGSFTFPYNISDWAWSYIRRHPEVLE